MFLQLKRQVPGCLAERMGRGVAQVSELTTKPIVPDTRRYVARGDDLGRVEIRRLAVNGHSIVALDENNAQEKTTDNLGCQPEAECLERRQHAERTAQKKKVMDQKPQALSQTLSESHGLSRVPQACEYMHAVHAVYFPHGQDRNSLMQRCGWHVQECHTKSTYHHLETLEHLTKLLSHSRAMSSTELPESCFDLGHARGQ